MDMENNVESFYRYQKRVAYLIGLCQQAFVMVLKCAQVAWVKNAHLTLEQTRQLLGFLTIAYPITHLLPFLLSPSSQLTAVRRVPFLTILSVYLNCRFPSAFVTTIVSYLSSCYNGRW
ncbi:hypothetical protein L1887_13081 [Cichorium endivia]|nr:hypothetical protein L1887_13081 [Cichorium endivia]